MRRVAPLTAAHADKLLQRAFDAIQSSDVAQLVIRINMDTMLVQHLHRSGDRLLEQCTRNQWYQFSIFF